MLFDLYSNLGAQCIYMESRATQGSETRTTQDDALNASFQVSPASGIGRGRALAIAIVERDASAAAADSVTVTIRKCTDDAGTGGTSFVAMTAVAGTGAAATSVVTAALDLAQLGSTYDYLDASVAYVDANSSGSYKVAVLIVYLPTKI